MQIKELPDSAKRGLIGVDRMAGWFGQFFVRQAQRIVDQAMNDDNKSGR